MATLGDKVTETLVSAIGKGLESAGLAHHADAKAIIESRVTTYMALMDPLSPEYAEISHLVSNTSFVDVILMLAGAIFGVIQSIWTMGAPTAEQLGQASWQVKPVRLPPPQTLISASWRGVEEDPNLSLYLERLGYNTLAQDALKSALRQPLRAEDIMELHRRGKISPAQQTQYLNGAGYDIEARAGLLNLQWRLPGAQDLIRFAVREVWNPEIAGKFQQEADFPQQFSDEARKSGMTDQVAKWYWSAHWDLPSISQGYDMVHRTVLQSKDPDADTIRLPSGATVQNVIGEKTLKLLLQAQDVMPFWRDKVTDIAYQPLTRVDVRRMYQLGVFTEDEVYRSYRDLGYSHENAMSLVAFTKVYYGPEDETGEEADRDWTKAEILDGYRKKIITTDQARLALREMSYAEAKIDFFLAREDLKAVQTRKQAYLDRWHSLYINGIAGAQDVYTNLGALGISQAEVDDLLPLWNLEQLQTVTRPTKAERLKWFKSGIITQATWESELRLDGYSDAYIAMYLADAQSA
jgi:hypothetical protein